MSLDFPSLGSPFTGEPVKPIRVVAGFWRRLLALVIDMVVTGAPCLILGFAFYDFFSASRLAGAVIGFALTLPYFAILGSSMGGGQTIGHRRAHIQVVDADGNLLSLKRSFVRYLIFLIPFLLDEAIPSSVPPGVATGVSGLLSIGGMAILYLYLFNVRTRQSLHDIAVGAYVVDTPSGGKVKAPTFWKWHWAILGTAVVVGAALGIIFEGWLVGRDPFPELIDVQQAVLTSDKVQVVGVALQRNWVNGQTTTGIRVDVVWKGKPGDYERAGSEIAAIILKTNAQAAKRDYIAVNFLEGFKVGFATFSKKQRVSHPPEDWERRINHPEP